MATPTLTTAPEVRPRLDQLRALLVEFEADALVVSALHDLRWATGFTGSSGLLIVSQNAAWFVTDGRYDEQARREVQTAEVHIATGELFTYVSEQTWLDQASTALVQGDHLSVSAFRKLTKQWPHLVVWARENLLVGFVAAKSDREIAHVRAAQAVTDDVFAAILSKIRLGVTERELAAEITYQHLRRGASAMAFDPIVASGPNSALPHARPTDRAFQSGDVVLIDMGAYLDGYASDMTRTVVLGTATPRVRDVYGAVLHAQEQAINSARGGMSGKDLDGVARSALTGHGLAERFRHSLGHGVGLQIHEWPRISQHADHTLPVGATITIEPGVYLAGEFGVRIEDIVALRSGGCDNLTATPKALLEL